MRMALRGAGITLVHDPFALQYVQRNDLVPVLPDWRSAPVTAWAVFPGRRLMPTRTRVFIDALVERFNGPECAAVKADLAQARRDSHEQKVGSPRRAALTSDRR